MNWRSIEDAAGQWLGSIEHEAGQWPFESGFIWQCSSQLEATAIEVNMTFFKGSWQGTLGAWNRWLVKTLTYCNQLLILPLHYISLGSGKITAGCMFGLSMLSWMLLLFMGSWQNRQLTKPQHTSICNQYLFSLVSTISNVYPQSSKHHHHYQCMADGYGCSCVPLSLDLSQFNLNLNNLCHWRYNGLKERYSTMQGIIAEEVYNTSLSQQSLASKMFQPPIADRTTYSCDRLSAAVTMWYYWC